VVNFEATVLTIDCTCAAVVLQPDTPP